MARQRRSVRASRGPKNNIWTVVQVSNAAQSSSPSGADIVIASDWVASAGFERATLLSIRGYISAAPDVVDVSTGSLAMLIYIADKDTANVDPQAVATYTEEDVLWTGGAQASGQGIAAIEARPSFNWEVNVKSMRRITNGEDVRIGAAASVGLDWRWTFVLRALLRRGGN